MRKAPSLQEDVNLLAISTSTSLHQVWLQTPTFQAGLQQLAGRAEPRALTQHVWSLLDQAKLQLSDVQLFACDVGPGSFTGLRQGLATVRTLAWATGKSAVAIGSLEAMVAEVRATGEQGAVAVALPARSGVVYVGWSPSPGVLEPGLVPQSAALEFWALRAIGQRVATAGSALAAGPWAQALSAVAQVQPAAVPDHPLASRIAWLALAHAERALPALRLAPAYLAATEAEIHRGFTVEAEALPADRR